MKSFTGKLLATTFLATALAPSIASAAGVNDLWAQIIKQVSKNNKQKELVLSSTTVFKPKFVTQPKLVSFKGVIQIPEDMWLTKGKGKIANNAAELIIDGGSIVCTYSPRSVFLWNHKQYRLRDCSNGSRANSNVSVAQKIELRLNSATSDNDAVILT